MPMRIPLGTNWSAVAWWVPIMKKPNPVTPMATTRERSVRPKSKLTGIGIKKASIAMKCIDQIPPPMAIAAVASQASLAHRPETLMRPPRSSAV